MTYEHSRSFSARISPDSLVCLVFLAMRPPTWSDHLAEASPGSGLRLLSQVGGIFVERSRRGPARNVRRSLRNPGGLGPCLVLNLNIPLIGQSAVDRGHRWIRANSCRLTANKQDYCYLERRVFER